MFGQDKPLIAPREPNSLAQVGISPLDRRRESVALAAAGARRTAVSSGRSHHLPRAGRRFRNARGLRLRSAGLCFFARKMRGPRCKAVFRWRTAWMTSGASKSARASMPVPRMSPESTVPSRVFAIDWFANPWRKLEFSGDVFPRPKPDEPRRHRAGFHHRERIGDVIPVHADGGWATTEFSADAAPDLQFVWRRAGQPRPRSAVATASPRTGLRRQPDVPPRAQCDSQPRNRAGANRLVWAWGIG